VQHVNQALKENNPEMMLEHGSSAHHTACADRLAMSKYKALHNSVCFMCLISRDAHDYTHDRRISYGGDQIQVHHNGTAVTIPRTLDPEQILRNGSMRELKQCPPSCIGPVHKDLGVNTTDELGVFHLMETQLSCGVGALIDVRSPDQYATETIPGSLNLPYISFYAQPNSTELVTTLAKLGVRPCVRDNRRTYAGDHTNSTAAARKNVAWDFSRAKDLVIWCYGPLGSLSTLAIAGLLELGYPATKISYYRGGLQLWKAFGLTTVVA